MTMGSTNTQISSDERDPALDRRSQRIVEDGKPVILRSRQGSEMQGRSIDEAYGGIGVLVEQLPHLVKGQEADVFYNGMRMTGVVRYVGPSGEDDGYRIGLAWKGAILSQRARTALKVRREGGHSSPNPAFETLVRSIPGGVHTMWSLYESENQVELGEATARMAKLGRAAGIGGLTPLADEVRTLVAEKASYEAIGSALHQLVEGCIAIVESCKD